MKWLLLFCGLNLLLLKSHTHFDHHDFYTSIDSTDSELFLPLIKQPFTYIGQGEQMYAFESCDGSYVLKIFKGKKKQHFKFKRILAQLKNRAGAREEWKSKFNDTCRRYEIALDHLKEETGLIHLHFHKTTAPLPVTLIDRTAYQLDLSTLPFIIQKKAVMAPDYFRQNPEKRAQAKQALKDFFTKRIEKGFSDPRQSLTINYGFIDDTPIQIDVGKIERFQGDVEAELKKIHAHVDEWVSRF